MLRALPQLCRRRIWDWEAPAGRHQSWQRLAGTLGPNSRCLLASFPFSVSIFISVFLCIPLDRDVGEQGHTKLVQALGWNCDGTKLASASAGSDVRVWSVETHKDGKEVVLEDHKQGIDGLSWSPTSPDVSSARLQLVSARYPVTRRRTHPPAPRACMH